MASSSKSVIWTSQKRAVKKRRLVVGHCIVGESFQNSQNSLEFWALGFLFKFGQNEMRIIIKWQELFVSFKFLPLKSGVLDPLISIR